jgi:hypothetical protein
MPRVTCGFCGLPFNVRNVREGAVYYCCSGCALASRIPVNEGQMPVSRGLVIALALGFGLFNQILFGALGLALVGEGRAAVGGKLLIVSWSVGAALLVADFVFMATAELRRWTDLMAALLAIALAGAALASIAGGSAGTMTGLLLAATGWLALWLSRGWLRRAWVRTRG